MTLDFKKEGDSIYLLGVATNDINSSEYLHNICGVKYSPAPHFNLEEEYQLQQKVTKLIKDKIISSAHDISEGGLFVTLCEAGFNKELGFSIQIPPFKEEGVGIRSDAYLFGEGQSRVVVSVAAADIAAFEKTMAGFPCNKMGMVTNGEIMINNDFWGTIDWWQEAYDTAIENYLSKESAGAALASI